MMARQFQIVNQILGRTLSMRSRRNSMGQSNDGIVTTERSSHYPFRETQWIFPFNSLTDGTDMGGRTNDYQDKVYLRRSCVVQGQVVRRYRDFRGISEDKRGNGPNLQTVTARTAWACSVQMRRPRRSPHALIRGEVLIADQLTWQLTSHVLTRIGRFPLETSYYWRSSC
jgi:hypothetical protein